MLLQAGVRRLLRHPFACRMVVTIAAFTAIGDAQAQVARLPVPGAPGGVTTFVDVHVIPMDTERVLAHQTVVIEHGWITALGSASKVQVPAGAVRIDGREKYLIPGLGDCHAHIGATPFGGDPGLPPDRAAERRLFQWLADGVTTIRNLDYMDQGQGWPLKGADALRLRSRAAAGELLSPRIYTVGQWGPGHYTNFDATFGGVKDLPAPNLDSVAIYVAAYKAAGYDFLKTHNETPAIFEAVLAAARQVGIPVVGHVMSTLERALAGGMQSIEHMIGYPADESVSDSQAHALVEATRRAGVWNCVTMQAGGWPVHAKLAKALQDGGAGLLLGSDFPLGIGVHLELALLVQAGLTPFQALATGTKNFARYFGALNETGTIAGGKRADLALLNGNPLQDIRHTKQPAGVMIGGRWLARAALDQGLAARTPHRTAEGDHVTIPGVRP